MQFSSCKEGAKNGRRKSKTTRLFPGERDRGSRAAKLKASWTHLQMELTNLCSATGLQQLENKQPKRCFFSVISAAFHQNSKFLIPGMRVVEGFLLELRRRMRKARKSKRVEMERNKRSEKYRQKVANFPANLTRAPSPFLSPPQPVKTPGTAQQILA